MNLFKRHRSNFFSPLFYVDYKTKNEAKVKKNLVYGIALFKDRYKRLLVAQT